jgi:NTP pyrophosphatase (non-canonical NTP hydrolase)
MNRLEELLVILSEECAEVSQAASKCIRFGMTATHPLHPESNQLRLEQELGDFLAMMKLLIEENSLNEANIMSAAEAKLIKVEKFMRNGISPAPSPFSKPHRRGPRQKSR